MKIRDRLPTFQKLSQSKNFWEVIAVKKLLESLLQCLKRIVVLANFPKVITIKKLLESYRCQKTFGKFIALLETNCSACQLSKS